MSDSEKSYPITVVQPKEIVLLFERAIEGVREELAQNPYLIEALRVLPVGGYRSAIGSVWNAVVDDLRNKIIHRSVELFNKALNLQRRVETYEDFQNYVTDDHLIEGAYKIGVIGWEASKMLRHAKETRHVFDGHPRSTEPSIIKVLAMLDDCVRYVLSQPYPPKIIDIDEYIRLMGSADYDRNEIAVENAFSELPEVYKVELVNRLFSAYVHQDASSILRSNIEFSAPILWDVLSKDVKIQVVRRVDQEISAGNAIRTSQAFAFVNTVGEQRYLTVTARRYNIAPIVKKLKENLDQWDIENKCVQELEQYAGYVPPDLHDDYVKSLTMTYVGYIGGSYSYRRSDFYADGAALRIPKMLQMFDDSAAASFVKGIKGNSTLRRRISNPVKLNRLRNLGKIVLDKVSERFSERDFIEALVDPDREEEFFDLL